jgi:hypothetical protein
MPLAAPPAPEMVAPVANMLEAALGAGPRLERKGPSTEQRRGQGPHERKRKGMPYERRCQDPPVAPWPCRPGLPVD